jgi:hypothetical protein
MEMISEKLTANNAKGSVCGFIWGAVRPFAMRELVTRRELKSE